MTTLDGIESWKKWRSKISWHIPFKVGHLFLGHDEYQSNRNLNVEKKTLSPNYIQIK